MKAFWYFLLELFFFHKRSGKLQFVLTLPNGTTIRTNNMDITISAVDESIRLAVIGTDAKGNKTEIPEGGITWENSASDVIEEVQSSNGLTAMLSPVGGVGSSTITAAIGELVATANVTVVAGPTVGLDFEKV